MSAMARLGVVTRHRRLGWVLLAVLLALPGCVAIEDGYDDISAPPKPEQQKAAPAAPAEAAKPPDIVILDLHEEAGPEPSLVRIVGTIVNRSNQELGRLNVRVEARDPQGRVLSRVIVPSWADAIPVGGSSGFDASLPRSGSIRNYHAEVMR
jgi:hypothetical protein